MSIQRVYKFCIATGLAYTSFYCLIGTNLVQAQSITPDNTLPTPTQVSPTATGVEISGGTERGSNLFHSFGDFSVPNGSEAFFNNADTISNIITRVTGGKLSTIDGLIRANDANLFFLNPAGILFGANARLDIGGSFYGSTADSWIFPEGEFSATNPQALATLIINAPIGLNLRGDLQPITVQSVANNVGLEVDTGKTLALIGGDINIDGGTIIAPGARVELGGLSAEGEVGIKADGSLIFPDGIAKADVSFTNSSFIDVSGEVGGNININANNVDILEDSELQGGTFSDGFANSQSGDIVINATGDIKIDSSTIDNAVEIGNAGTINLTANNLSLTNGSKIDNSTFGDGNAGNVTLNIDGAVELTDGIIFSNVEGGAVGDGGTVTINSDSLSLIDGGQIQTSVLGQNETQNGGVGNAGNVSIDVDGDVILSGANQSGLRSAIFSDTEPGSIGNAGNITINARSLSLQNGFLENSISGKGSAGDINLDIDGGVTLNNNGEISSEVRTSAVLPEEEVGTVTINADSLSIADGASSISTYTSGQGNAGNVTLDIDGAVKLTDGNIFSNVEAGALGNGGTVTINSGSLSLINGGQIQTLVREGSENLAGGKGNAGNVIIDVDGKVNISGKDLDKNFSAIYSTLETGAKGIAGNIEVTANSLTLKDGGLLTSSTSSTGNAGNITLNIDNAVELTDGNIFSNVEAGALGNGGTVTINSGSLSLINGGQIQTLIREGSENLAAGEGKAGNVIIDVDGKVNISGNDSDENFSAIYSTLETGAKGNAGNIEVTANSFNLNNGGYLTSSTSSTGNAGNVTLNIDGAVELTDGIIFSNVEAGAVGDGGTVTINSDSLSLTEGSNIQTIVRGIDQGEIAGNGDAGDIVIDVNKNVTIAGSSSAIFSELRPGTKGSAGNIQIAANSLNLKDGGFLNSSTSGEGNAGNITIDSETSSLSNSSQINSSTYGQGNAGTININASDTIVIDGQGNVTGINNIVGINAVGNAGEINIRTSNLNLTFGGLINASTYGQGKGGNIFVKADSLTLDTGGIGAVNFPSQPISTDQTGNITLEIADNLILRNNSLISARAGQNATGGNITIDANDGFVIAFPSNRNENGNDITASAAQGKGGLVTINAQQIFNLEERKALPGNGTNDIDVSSEAGLNGRVNLTIFKDDILRNTNQLPRNPIEPNQTVAQSCSSQGFAEGGNSFTVTGKGGVPPEPTAPFSPDAINIEGKSVTSETLSNQPHPQPQGILTSQGYIIPAQGIVKTPDGKVMLVGYPVDNTNQRIPVRSANCGKS